MECGAARAGRADRFAPSNVHATTFNAIRRFDVY
jgi:hypothetical protein